MALNKKISESKTESKKNIETKETTTVSKNAETKNVNKKKQSPISHVDTSKTSQKAKSDKKVGRPAKYSILVVKKWLKAFEGQPGGLGAAWKNTQRETGHETISFMTMCNYAKVLGIKFGRGKPLTDPSPVLPKKKKAA